MTKSSFLNIHTHLENVRPDSIATIRKSLVHLCDGNFCAAMILDQFYFDAYVHIEFMRHERRTRSLNSSEVTTSVEDIAEMTCGMFTEQDVIQSLRVIANKNYATIKIGLDNTVTYEIDFTTIERAIDLYQGKEVQDIIYVEEIAPSTNSIVEKVPQQTEVQRVRRSEAKAVRFHNKRAEMVALPATLTLEEWKVTLEYYNYKCAYCLTNDYHVLEHFIPLVFGGGTTAYNCVPSCTACNGYKSDQHPSMFPSSSKIYDALSRVQKYLESRKAQNVESEL